MVGRGPVVGEARVKILTDMSGVSRDVHRELEKAKLEQTGAKFGRQFRQGFEKEVKKDSTTGFLRGIDRALQRIKSRDVDISRIFGRGSRNNFLNALGRLVGGLTSIIKLPFELATKGILAAGQAMGFFAKTAGDAEANASTFGQTMAKLGTTIVSALTEGILVGLPALGVLVVALGAVVEIAGIAAAALSALAGIALALASAVGIGLVGALGAVAPLLLPVVAGIAALAIAFSGLTKKQRGKLFAPITASFKEMQRTLRGELFAGLKQDIPAISEMLRNVFTPALKGVLQAVLDTGHAFFTTFGPGTPARRALVSIGEALKPLAETLGRATVSALAALAGVFQVLMPLGQKLADAIARIAQKFADWVLSAKGQKALTNFFTDAWNAATDLWDIVVLIGEAIAAILGKPAAKSTGKTFLDDIKAKLQDLVDWLNDPKNKKAIDDFFLNAQVIAQDLAAIIGNLGNAFDKLDTKKSRDQLDDLSKKVNDTVSIATLSFGALKAVFDAALSPIKAIGLALRGLGEIFSGDVSKGVADLGNALLAMPLALITAGSALIDFGAKLAGFNVNTRVWASSFVASVSNVAMTVPGLIRAIVNPFGSVTSLIVHALGSLAGPLVSWISGATGLSVGAVHRLLAAIANPFGTLTNLISGALGSLAGVLVRWISGATGSAVGAVHRLISSIAGAFTSLPGRIASALAGMAGELARALQGQINDAIGRIHIPLPHIPHIPGTSIGGAAGGIFSGPQNMLIAEEGPEALVPLHRSLSRVDPAVRELSAIAQGLRRPPTMDNPPAPQKVVNLTMHVTPQAADPEAVAQQVINKAVALVR
jgi:hypothetical protein